MDVYVVDLDALGRQECEVGLSALIALDCLSKLIPQPGGVRSLPDRELAGVMILCRVIMRLAAQSISPYARASAVTCAKIYAVAGTTSGFSIPEKSVMELLDQLDSREGE